MMENQQQNEKNDSQLDQNKQEKQLSQGANVALTGFIGGLFWSALAQLAYYFHFTEVAPKVILMGVFSDRLSHGIIGNLIAILLYGLVSIVVAFIYYAILRKIRSIFVGILFGAAIWALVHLALVPFFPGLLNIMEMNFNTLVTTLCLYILYGVFIGVSIGFDYNERSQQQKVNQQEQKMEH